MSNDLDRLFVGDWRVTPWWLRLVGKPFYRRILWRKADLTQYAYEYSNTKGV